MEEKKRFTLTCTCGCGDAIEFHYAYGAFWIDCLASLHRERQHIFDIAWRLHELRTHCFHELCLEREDIAALHKFLCEIGEVEEEPVKNYSRLEFEYHEDLDTYFLRLEAKPFLKMLLTGKLYRIYTISFDRRMTEALKKAVRGMLLD